MQPPRSGYRVFSSAAPLRMWVWAIEQKGRRGFAIQADSADANAVKRAAVVAAQAAIPYLKQGGRIVTIGSNAAQRVPFGTLTVHSLTKSMVASTPDRRRRRPQNRSIMGS